MATLLETLSARIGQGWVKLASKPILLKNVKWATGNNEAVPYQQALKLDADGTTVSITGKTFSGDNTYSGTNTHSGALSVTGSLAFKRATVVTTADATVAITAAQSGTLFVMSKADGIAYTLPTPAVGLWYEFMVLTSVTSNAYAINGGGATHLMIGSILSEDTDTSEAIVGFRPNGSSNYQLSMNGSTTGGLLGTVIRVTAISTTRWSVSGVVFGSGTVETPFAG